MCTEIADWADEGPRAGGWRCQKALYVWCTVARPWRPNRSIVCSVDLKKLRGVVWCSLRGRKGRKVRVVGYKCVAGIW